MTPDEIRAKAVEIILDHARDIEYRARDIEYGSIHKMLPDGLTAAERDAAAGQVDVLIATATITITVELAEDPRTAETLPEVNERATRYEISVLPPDHPAAWRYTVTVEDRGWDQWAVLSQHMALNNAGGWDVEPSSGNRTPEWAADHYVDLASARRLARRLAPTLTVRGRGVADVLAEAE